MSLPIHPEGRVVRENTHEAERSGGRLWRQGRVCECGGLLAQECAQNFAFFLGSNSRLEKSKATVAAVADNFRGIPTGMGIFRTADSLSLQPTMGPLVSDNGRLTHPRSEGLAGFVSGAALWVSHDIKLS